jgi:hypothetical protein
MGGTAWRVVSWKGCFIALCKEKQVGINRVFLNETAINLIYFLHAFNLTNIEGKKACLLTQEKFYMLTSQQEKQEPSH